ncbi:hypothetical protein FNV43_RR04417 [Rhamnella rubrinervis]|uniref:Uncharacterized protein n=1 Tax=Rhamnella rubrinervis TaxID=2594499 RepID=A0A8K0HLQ5_9ROSA|nr:hypothetical protein FNV43_RR04417 [Rhamnella rubrinervis]
MIRIERGKFPRLGIGSSRLVDQVLWQAWTNDLANSIRPLRTWNLIEKKLDNVKSLYVLFSRGGLLGYRVLKPFLLSPQLDLVANIMDPMDTKDASMVVLIHSQYTNWHFDTRSKGKWIFYCSTSEKDDKFSSNVQSVNYCPLHVTGPLIGGEDRLSAGHAITIVAWNLCGEGEGRSADGYYQSDLAWDCRWPVANAAVLCSTQMISNCEGGLAMASSSCRSMLFSTK